MRGFILLDEMGRTYDAFVHNGMWFGLKPHGKVQNALSQRGRSGQR